MAKTIAVVGNLNQDLVTRVAVSPGPGVTVFGSDLSQNAGGKALNQAGAAGRLGRETQTRMIGRVGDDEFGTQLRERLAAANVNVDAVLVTQGRPSGVALIIVEESGQNRIIVIQGANDALGPDDVTRALASFREPPAVLLLQLESPIAAVEAAALDARRRGTTVILDPAPVPSAFPEALLRHVDILTPNESEALALLGDGGHDISLKDAPTVAQRLRLRSGVATVILKMGAKGAWLQSETLSQHVAAPKVDAIDTTAAGDTFNGAFAVMLTEGGELLTAIEFANCAAALSVTRRGALASIPERHEVDELWRKTGKLGPPRGR